MDTQEYELEIEENSDAKQQAEEVSVEDGKQQQEDIDTQEYNDFHEHDNKDEGTNYDNKNKR
eukprot:12568061-Heterocapsa_arctica.AAC.1